ncbi:hypothetical protein E7T06_18520 [Deinococcus sp. Arct2-2]|uniref:hypothetical protein n=1 Tax=Deinococcus sp. Arct2-2 TaxID=2568653 RepID=UPI0010A2B843|nr:hypothetical protein [Deinococcus sp. Arct2-2]THF68032.1 hypothetical protein E7T06_18520 [Deinococcus sp. Arct2-2]
MTVKEETLHLQVHPLLGPHTLLPLQLARVFNAVRVTPDGLALRWPGGFTLPMTLLSSRRTPRWLTLLGTLPVADRFRPLLPLLRHCTPGVALRVQPTRVQLMRMFTLRAGELDMILSAFPVPEDIMLHRLHDIGLFLQHHLYADVPIAILRRPWAYAAHRYPHRQSLHTMMACLTFGRLDLIEAPLWALARAEVLH